MSLQEHRPLIVRGNRALGTLLLEKKLITPEQLDAANEKLLENLESGDPRRAGILHVLLFEMQILNEDAYLEALIEKQGASLIDLQGCLFRKFADLQFDSAACWATWTVPFDLVDDFCLLATAFFPSQPVVKFWQEKFAGRNLLWYVTSVRSFQAAMEKLEQMKGDAAKTASHQAGVKSGSTVGRGHTKSPIPVKK